MQNLLTVAEFRVIHTHKPQAQTRLGRRYVLVLEACPAQNIYHLTHYRSGSYRAATVHANWFPTYEALLLNAQQKIKRRFQHGYSLIGWDANFPLVDWMHQRNYPFEPLTTFQRPPIQLYLPHLSAS